LKVKTEPNRVVITLDKPTTQIFVSPKVQIEVSQDKVKRVYLKILGLYQRCPICGEFVEIGKGTEHLNKQHPELAKTHIWIEGI